MLKLIVMCITTLTLGAKKPSELNLANKLINSNQPLSKNEPGLNLA